MSADLNVLEDFIKGDFGGGSYNRLGDCEIAVLRAWDMGLQDDWSDLSARKTGLSPSHAEGLRVALEGTTFLDMCMNQSINTKYAHTVGLSFNNTFLNSSTNGNLIRKYIFDGRLKALLGSRRVLFFGAEAALLSRLLEFSEFLNLSQDYFPQDVSLMEFYTPVNYGRDLGQNLDRTIMDLSSYISRNSYDVVFVSGGGLRRSLPPRFRGHYQVFSLISVVI